MVRRRDCSTFPFGPSTRGYIGAGFPTSDSVRDPFASTGRTYSSGLTFSELVRGAGSERRRLRVHVLGGADDSIFYAVLLFLARRAGRPQRHTRTC